MGSPQSWSLKCRSPRLDVDVPDNTDGWGMILWAGDAKKIVAATRTALSLYSISTTVQHLKIPDCGLKNGSEWILDIKRCSSSDEFIVLLTSVTITLLRVLPETAQLGDESSNAAEVLLSWPHQRFGQDPSLRLLTFGNEDREAPTSSCNGSH